MKPLLAIFSILILINSCKNKQDFPKDIIKPDSINLILHDIQIIEAGLGIMHNHEIDEVKYITPLYNKLLQKYNLSNTRFKSSLNYYFKNPKLLDESYQNLIPILVEMQTINNNEKPNETK